jgi:multiple sugar transport system substrate-binding protein
MKQVACNTRIARRTALRGLAGAASSLPGLLSPKGSRAQASATLTVGIWGDLGSVAAYKNLIARFKTVRPDIDIKLETTPFGQYYQQLDTRLAGRQAPDVFRLEYQVVGRYARSRALMDLTPQFGGAFGRAFAAPFWRAVNHEDKTFAVPQNTDTLGIFYNVDLFQKLGIKAPGAIAESWRWPEFIDVARALKKSGDVPYAFAMLWQESQGYRWLPFLYQHGGRLLGEDLRTPEIDGPTGIETIAWTQRWFGDELVPPSTAVKSHEQPAILFANGTVGMFIGGDWQMPSLAQNVSGFKWAATYMPRDVAMASDFGGSCNAISSATKNPQAAIDFMTYMTSEAAQRDFILDGQFLPARTAFIERPLDYPFRPDARRVFLEQAATVPLHLAQTVVLPEFSRINQRLADQLDLAYTSGQKPDVTAANISAAIKTIMAS